MKQYAFFLAILISTSVLGVSAENTGHAIVDFSAVRGKNKDVKLVWEFKQGEECRIHFPGGGNMKVKNFGQLEITDASKGELYELICEHERKELRIN